MDFLIKLLQRAVLLLAAIPALLIAYLGGWLLAVLVALMAIIALSEYYSALYRQGLRPSATIGFIGGVLVVLSANVADPASSWMFTVLALALTVLLSMIAQLLKGDGQDAVANSAATVFGVVYVALFLSFMLRLRGYDLAQAIGTQGTTIFSQRLGALLMVIVPIWCLDTGALVVGSLWGRHKLAPGISPGKTVEGAVGGFLVCVGLALVMGSLVGLPLVHRLLLGVLMGVVAQLGDLCKSALKRDIGIKDFGALFGPHGGMIDRFDGVMFALPVVYFYFVTVFGMHTP